MCSPKGEFVPVPEGSLFHGFRPVKSSTRSRKVLRERQSRPSTRRQSRPSTRRQKDLRMRQVNLPRGSQVLEQDEAIKTFHVRQSSLPREKKALR